MTDTELIRLTAEIKRLESDIEAWKSATGCVDPCEARVKGIPRVTHSDVTWKAITERLTKEHDEAGIQLKACQGALAFIDSICGDDFCEDLGMRMAVTEVTLTGREIEAAKKLLAIYRAAHSHAPGFCYEAHDAWRKEVSDAIAAQAADGGKDA